MALTVRKGLGQDMANQGFHPKQGWMLISVDFDSSYPTGGEAIDIGQPVYDMIYLGGGTYWFEYDPVNKKIKAMKTAAGVKTEEANTTDLSAQTDVRFLALLAEV